MKETCWLSGEWMEFKFRKCDDDDDDDDNNIASNTIVCHQYHFLRVIKLVMMFISLVVTKNFPVIRKVLSVKFQEPV
jgi:hypothetical protein